MIPLGKFKFPRVIRDQDVIGKSFETFSALIFHSCFKRDKVEWLRKPRESVMQKLLKRDASVWLRTKKDKMSFPFFLPLPQHIGEVFIANLSRRV